MALSNKEIEKQLRKLFVEINNKVADIVSTSRTTTEATERIMRIVSSSVSAEAEGYLIDMYSDYVDRIKKEEFFQKPEHLNAFYRLNLRDEINEKYQFNIENIDAFKKGIEYKELNQLYVTAGSAAGTLAVGGILKYALSNIVNIPFAIVIAGAFALACVAYFSVPNRNKREYKKAIEKFLIELENGILDWFVDIEVYFDERVRSLYK